MKILIPVVLSLVRICEAIDLSEVAGAAGQFLTTANTAQEALKNGLHNVKVSKYDVTEVQRKLEGELFDMWEEGSEVMEAKGIAMDDIQEFLDHMKDAYDGIDDVLRKKLDGIKWTKEWSNKIFEFKYNNKDKSGARYGMVAFGKSPDHKTVDCMYVMYKMDFKIAPEIIVHRHSHSALFGIISWETTRTEVRERTLGMKSIKVFQNFFRYKALQGFYKEGLIDKITFVPTIDDIDVEDEHSPHGERHDEF